MTSTPPTKSNETSGGPLDVKLSKSRSASKPPGSSIKWASSMIKSGRTPAQGHRGERRSDAPNRTGQARSRRGRRGEFVREEFEQFLGGHRRKSQMNRRPAHLPRQLPRQDRFARSRRSKQKRRSLTVLQAVAQAMQGRLATRRQHEVAGVARLRKRTGRKAEMGLVQETRTSGEGKNYDRNTEDREKGEKSIQNARDPKCKRSKM